jgi:capsular exopolysaccharide synthesis family protein
MHVQEDTAGTPEVDLRHYFGAVRRRKWILLLMTLLFAAGAFAWADQKDDRYRATGELLILAPSAVEADLRSLSDEPERAVANEIAILSSEAMQNAVDDVLGPGHPGVTASGNEDNDVITLTAESTRPRAASEAVNAWATAYVRVRRQRSVQDLQASLRQRERERDALQQELRIMEEPYNEVLDQIEVTPPGPELDALIAERDALIAERGPARDELVDEIEDLRVLIGDLRRTLRDPTQSVEILNRASIPTEPFFPQPRKDLMVGAVVGLLLGLALAFVIEALDDAVRGKSDIDRATGGLPILGAIPQIAGWKNRADPQLVMRSKSRSAAAEAYRALVTSIEFLGAAGDARVVLLTSPGASEGKTTTIANLGWAFAEAGHRAVVVDADLRRPRIHHFYGIPGQVGLTTALAGKIDITTSMQVVGEEVGVHVVAAGPVPPNPAELLRLDGLDTALTKLRETHDVVLIDSPPVLPVADALVIARHVDAVVLLAAAGVTSRRKLGRAAEALHQVAAPLRGVVLNGVGTSDGYEYGYYGADDDRRRDRRRRKKRRPRT